VLTIKDVDDGSQVGPLLDHVGDPVASFTGDGAYDQDGVTASVTERYGRDRPSAAIPTAARLEPSPQTTDHSTA